MTSFSACGKFLLSVLVISLQFSSRVGVLGSCPCKDAALCEPVKTPQPTVEVLGWSVSTGLWRHYDWEKVTTIGVFRAWDSDADEMLCYAHSKNVRVVLPGNFPVANLTNKAARESFVRRMAEQARQLHTDGVNFDIEDAIEQSSPEREALVVLINSTRTELRKQNPHAQITADVAWSPDCIDGRCYDVKAMAEVTDYLAVMSYDERSQIRPPQPCVAMSNSPATMTFDGVRKYIEAGVPASKLVLGQPWYGYNYPCESFDAATSTCTIAKVPFRGAPCSDAAGKEYSFSWIQRNLKESGATRLWNATQLSPFYNFVDKSDGKHHQVSNRVTSRVGS